jgi:hypothetical protein
VEIIVRLEPSWAHREPPIEESGGFCSYVEVAVRDGVRGVGSQCGLHGPAGIDLDDPYL